jgi:hypothetical protein
MIVSLVPAFPIFFLIVIGQGVFTDELSPYQVLDIEHPTPPLIGSTLVFPEPGLPGGPSPRRGGCLPSSSRSFGSVGTIGLWLLFSAQARPLL